MQKQPEAARQNSDDQDGKLPWWAKTIDCSFRSMLVKHGMEGPICHAGSLINKPDVPESSVNNWRNAFSELKQPEFVGIDLFSGPNVDIMADLCADNFLQEHHDLKDRFGLVICWALLEHVANPFSAAKHITAMLRPGGHLYFIGPWVWGYHPYPKDYWRISFDGLQVLFPDIEFDQSWYSGTIANVGIEITEFARERKLFLQTSVCGAASKVSDRGMPYLNLGAIGRRLQPK